MAVKILPSFPLVPIQQWYGWIMYGSLNDDSQPSRNLFFCCMCFRSTENGLSPHLRLCSGGPWLKTTLDFLRPLHIPAWMPRAVGGLWRWNSVCWCPRALASRLWTKPHVGREQTQEEDNPTPSEIEGKWFVSSALDFNLLTQSSHRPLFSLVPLNILL